MALPTDSLVERKQLKRQIMRWRTVAIVSVALAVIGLLGLQNEELSPVSTGDYIARVDVNALVTDDRKRNEMLQELKKDEDVKAVLVYCDTPGGTAVGGEELYLQLRDIASEKPVVALMRDVCTSAGYMTAIGADYILARAGTITGSIGVIVQSVEVTELADKIGVKPVIVKSAPLKATPNPLEKVTEDQREAVKDVVNDFYRYFASLVQQRRNLSDQQLEIVADGRIFSGAQALEYNLIDAIGGEREALNWLAENHELDAGAKVRTVQPKREAAQWWKALEQMSNLSFLSESSLTLDGMLLIWQPVPR
ncbi:MAG: signal peptide peptidase SppA [Rickettsiales bacterium]|nr:signal peptide peptidase SppA [Rickettsiales bacterium]